MFPIPGPVGGGQSLPSGARGGCVPGRWGAPSGGVQ